MRAIIYARCSTDESKQDTEVQLKELRAYCEREGWTYDEISEYGSGSKGVPPKLQRLLTLVSQRTYQVFLVHSLDRFSRLTPRTTEQMLNHITDSKCRFIALQQNLDSSNEMTWYAFKGLFSYFANLYSKNLSEKVKLGMARAKEKGKTLGRPVGSTDKKPRSKKGYYKREYKFKLN